VKLDSYGRRLGPFSSGLRHTVNWGVGTVAAKGGAGTSFLAILKLSELGTHILMELDDSLRPCH
jgi:hypothetical protein